MYQNRPVGVKRGYSNRKIFIKPLVLAVILILTIIFFVNKEASAPNSSKQESRPGSETESKHSGKFKTFSGKQFEELYNSFAYPNTRRINENTPITGNLEADARIRRLAKDRGYMLRSAPVTDTFVEIQKGMLLQQRAAADWKDLEQHARDENIRISLAAAYRSAEDQKNIFLSRLNQMGISIQGIASGNADAAIDLLLSRTALPGYSRHHTGYTVDMACDSQPEVRFENSICFKWLAKNNYLNAKRSGWIPSYPPGAGKQGPDPESWEYVWVGVNALR